jgi:hypothetical protein
MAAVQIRSDALSFSHHKIRLGTVYEKRGSKKMKNPVNNDTQNYRRQ